MKPSPRTYRYHAGRALLTALCLAAAGGAAKAQTSEKTLADIPRLDFVPAIRQGVQRSLPLLQNSSATFVERQGGTCVSCHHQSLPAMAYSVARTAGIQIDEEKAAAQTRFVVGLYGKMMPLLSKAPTDKAAEREMDKITVDPPATVSYALAGLAADGYRPDATTQAMAVYLMRKQAPDGRWPVFAARPPMEGSEFTATALTVRSLKTYTPSNLAAERDARVLRAKSWLVSAKPRSNEDRIFRMLGLRWAGADEKTIQAAAADLESRQNDDGGWGQTDGAASDAYATGQAVVALRQAARRSPMDTTCSRGTVYLMLNQREDGSWFVRKRTAPGQPYFDAGFPHDKSQFISHAGTSWAVMALSMSLPPSGPAVKTASLFR